MIESLESIEKIKFPKLTDFVFRDNLICSIRPLRKCYLPELKDLCGRGNFVSEVESTSRWNCPLVDNMNLSIKKDRLRQKLHRSEWVFPQNADEQAINFEIP